MKLQMFWSMDEEKYNKIFKKCDHLVDEIPDGLRQRKYICRKCGEEFTRIELEDLFPQRPERHGWKR